MNKKIIYLMAFFSILRLVLMFHHNPHLVMNPDEESNFDLAFQKVQGHDYTHVVDGVYVKSAFHSSFNVFMYEGLLHLGASKGIIVVVFNLITSIMFGISIAYMYLLSLRFLNQKLALAATWLYCLYPSVIYYVGTLYAYESLILSFIIMAVYYFLRMYQEEVISRWIYVLVLCIALFSVMLRPQTIPLWTMLFGLHFICFVRKGRCRMALYSVLFFVALICVHIPVLKKNHRMFGAYVLNTQTGFELLQGHNPTARGSWMGGWTEKGNPLYEYAHRNITGLDTMNELESSKARKKLAINWALNNPLMVVVLYLRKIAIYFMPINYEVLPYSNIYNPINLFVHLFFLVGFASAWFVGIRKLDYLWIAIPVLASLTITVVFFMGARWRYYAEPFMIIYALLGWEYLMRRFLKG